jgi:TonB family protein
MSVLIHRRRRSAREILPFFAAGALLLLLVALLVSRFVSRTEYRHLRTRVGEARILEQKYPVRDLDVRPPDVARAEVDPREGLIVRSDKPGLAEVTYERADGTRFHWFVQVRGNRPIRVSLSSVRRQLKRVARKAPEPRRLREEKPKEEKPPPPPEAKPKGQVVEIDKPAIERRPDEAKYLSEYDSKVKEEMRARDRSPKPRAVVPPEPQPPQRAERRPPTPAPPVARPALAPRPAAEPPPKPRPGPGAELPKIAMGPTAPEREPSPAEEDRRESRRLLQPGAQEGPGKIDITPRPDVIAQAVGGAFPDHLKGMKEGERTFLNTKAWKGASFFNRLKRAVAQHWNPGEVYRRRDPYGNIYGIKDRYTLLHITLNGDGSLKNLRVLTPSGIDFLDEEAVGAIEAAQPFPNPPAEIKDRDGLVRFAFGFYFEISERPLFRIYRYND